MYKRSFIELMFKAVLFCTGAALFYFKTGFLRGIRMDTFYKEAVKKGQKEKKNCLSEGKDPYLPALENLVSPEKMLAGINLGVQQVPTEFIVGTKSASRANAFARNFMPLLEENSEFGIKWKSLCDAHLEEGIHDSIKAYEYRNRYYVQEGNKRVSVLKFFDAVSIPTEVIRVMPVRDGSKEVEIYYEMVDFFKCTGINYLEFSETGCYKQIQKLMGKAPDEVWTEDDRSHFKTAFYNLKKAFQEISEEKEHITAADAMLTYCKIYGYSDLLSKSNEQIKKSLLKIWEELSLLEEKETIDLKENPEERQKRKFWKKIFGESGEKQEQVAFVYDKNPITSGWVYGHELGRLHTQKVFDGSVLTRAYDDAMDKDPKEVLEQVIRDGNNIIFTTSAKLLPASLAVAIEHPEVTIFNCSLNKSHRYICTYYARMYEAKFLIGAIAGAMAEEGKVGYLCDYPIYGQIAGINAFALGVQMVNPKAKVYLEWSCIDGAQSAEKRLREKGIRIISAQDLKSPTSEERSTFGLYEYKDEKRVNLAMPLWHWGVYYEKLIRNMRNQTFKMEYESSRKALNYYWGMSAGVIDLICSNHLPQSVKKLVNVLQDAICKGSFSPFGGVMMTQNGERLEGKDGTLTLQQIIGIDWLLENVAGEIPKYEMLSEDGKATVKSAGAPNAQYEEMENENIGNFR